MIDFAFSRRSLLAGAAAALICAAAPGLAPTPARADAADTAQKIADHFSAIRSMSGTFVQFGPRGEQTGGKFFIQRPGKVRFNYEAPSAYRVTADGRSVLISNTKLKTSDLYPLSKTPLKLLLDDRVSLSGSRVKSVQEEGGTVTIQIVDKSVFGNSKLTMMFDAKDYDLRQWTITDAQGKDTTVLIDNVRTGVSIDPKLFFIDYAAQRDNKRNKNVNR